MKPKATRILRRTAAAAAVLWLLLAAGPASACLIVAVGSAEQVDTGPYLGWFKYTYQVTWNLEKGLSHLDLLLKPGCAADDHLFRFETEAGGAADGLGTPKKWRPGKPITPITLSIPFEGIFEPHGDPSVDLDVPLIKWEPLGGDPGKRGTGAFWFYSNVLPETGTYEDVVVAKAGRKTIEGTLQGAWPSCRAIPPPVPEPATLALLATGGALVLIARRRR